MVQITLDDRTVTIEAGATILDAARKAGVHIPTLCYLEDCQPQTSCMVCVVRLEPGGKLVPACAYPVSDGLRVSSEVDEVLTIRKRNLELLLSEHLGDCEGPCTSACPAGMQIPLMIRQIATGDLEGAIKTIKRDIPLPAILGRICPAPCEGICRRKYHDEALAICQLKRFVADWDLANEQPYLPEIHGDSGKKVAIVGTGPAGLSGAWFLRTMGHSCQVFEEQDRPGGRLYESGTDRLSEETVLAEIRVIESLGCSIQLNTKIGRDITLENLRRQYDAVLIATGDGHLDGLVYHDTGLKVDMKTMQTSLEGVFAAGNVIRKGRIAIRSIGQAKNATRSIDNYLRGDKQDGLREAFTCHIGKIRDEEIRTFADAASQRGRVLTKEQKYEALTKEQSAWEAQRCLRCDCRKASDCRLRQVCQDYEIMAPKLKDNRPAFEQAIQINSKNARKVVYEKGKCIRCGLCVQITTREEERYGLSFTGRGFEAFIAVPLDHSLDEALTRSAEACVRACPTAALAFLE